MSMHSSASKASIVITKPTIQTPMMKVKFVGHRESSLGPSEVTIDGVHLKHKK
jgi:hypothetical protein